MTAWIFTFGHGQRLRSTNRMGRADFEWHGGTDVGEGFRLHDRYVRIEGEHDVAHERMVAIFGPVWSMEYREGPETVEMIERYGLVELDITEPIGEPRRAFLGLASTRELLREIKARGASEPHYRAAGDAMATGAANLLDALPEVILDYRTVGGRAVATP